MGRRSATRLLTVSSEGLGSVRVEVDDENPRIRTLDRIGGRTPAERRPGAPGA
ncbi:MAG TPA: hypothetical protein VFW24_07450 [Acidimicrobiales bacterium]|nr:hypothetical protein [Acidimicrobiales bacterium]